MKEFYIFRHGQTDMNVDKIWQGQGYNPHLNEKGISEAKKLATKLKNKGIEIIFSSPMFRAYETAEIVSSMLNVEIVKENDFIESSIGIMEGKIKPEIEKKYPIEYKKWRDLTLDTFDFGFLNGETKRQVVLRVLSKIKEIALNTDYEIVGISSHGAVLRWLSVYFNDANGEIPNCSYMKINFEKDFIYKGLNF
ncbi:MAG: Phosphoserine phosphatase 1 [Alphaproteobacteria bacterium ADurb.Bin438]|nr:MAG: Phosphoserine phosphatase 1 [Alphaproteobacteria bacterium ADurb.Bin438]